MTSGAVRAPEFPLDLVWLRPRKPRPLASFRGRFVLLDFWTFCCINCLHVLRELEDLEERYAEVLSVVGILSPKFPEEADPRKGLEAAARLGIRHFLALDAGMDLWRRYGVRAWPTLALVDPGGVLVHVGAGEGQGAVIARLLDTLVPKSPTLVRAPADYPPEATPPSGSLAYPGKLTVDEEILAVADSGHHRLLVLDRRAGTVRRFGSGRPGAEDGPAARASFRDPQGLVRVGGTLYVADRGNHLLRAVDLEDGSVRTLAGTGARGFEPSFRPGSPPRPARTSSLASPWDLAHVAGEIFIAMAGCHQVWSYDPRRELLHCRAGSGREDIVDGPAAAAALAQPSGLGTDGIRLFIADAETSAVRLFDPRTGGVSTLVGTGLFDFGDRDGPLAKTALQHPLAVAWADGRVWVADTYNGAIKILDPVRGTSTRILDGLEEPGGIAVDPEGFVWIAETNRHRILRHDPRSGETSVHPFAVA
ncbi:MAG: alkyl hydroperoxide reductase [Gammaproteobacteria bacterium]|nr:alkyl hydroperoxide reductase [Gammaproteobacteria bacterium]